MQSTEIFKWMIVDCTMSYVGSLKYCLSSELIKWRLQVLIRFMCCRRLHSCIKSVFLCRRFEVEIVAMTADMLHGDANVVGSVTSGGTESILCAIKAYRDRARHLYPYITEPEIVSDCVYVYVNTMHDLCMSVPL